jgi:hypothetical protein
MHIYLICMYLGGPEKRSVMKVADDNCNATLFRTGRGDLRRGLDARRIVRAAGFGRSLSYGEEG